MNLKRELKKIRRKFIRMRQMANITGTNDEYEQAAIEDFIKQRLINSAKLGANYEDFVIGDYADTSNNHMYIGLLDYFNFSKKHHLKIKYWNMFDVELDENDKNFAFKVTIYF